MLSWLLTCLLASLLHPLGEGTKIIGGREAKRHSRPYIALLNTDDYICGGTLIKSDWVLTAAHCSCNSSTKIKLGIHSLTAEDEYVQTFKAKKCIKHKFNKATFDNDLQIVQLSGKAQQTKAVKILSLPNIFSDVKEGTVCDTAGWGAITSNGLTFPNKLMEVKLPAISRKSCAEKWKPDVKITENMMCTFDATGEKDICGGDSGGPLLCNNKLRGIVSFGAEKCGDCELSSVYTFLTKAYVNWIKEKIIKK
ncbi:granzyme A-like [Pyxicephalus adspersus]|uniref:Peptidase S1 domain-containing protein n=1 Tax=Pyxicephalus adspersus TaxID=30357 RepID=A0AAV3AED6_PYXAD|nr:TPA: hypothetical protein GDO54_014619 [Pyxicephalus adspersus]